MTFSNYARSLSTNYSPNPADTFSIVNNISSEFHAHGHYFVNYCCPVCRIVTGTFLLEKKMREYLIIGRWKGLIIIILLRSLDVLKLYFS